MRKIFTVLLFFVLLVSLLACSNENSNSSKTDFRKEEQNKNIIKVTDMMGREVEIKKGVKKIVALQPADCEIIFSIGSGENVVGRGEYCDWPEGVKKVESLQSGEDTNIEQIIKLQPDIVFMGTMTQKPEQIEQLEKFGISVVVSEATNVDGVYKSINIIGKCLGKDKEANDLVKEMKNGFDELAKKVSKEEEKTIYYETSPLEFGIWTAGKNTFMNDIANVLGLKNIFEDVDGWAEVSQEQVIERNPDYIVSIAMNSDEGIKPTDEIMTRDGWKDIVAVKNKNVFLLDADELSRPGPRLVDGAKALYNAIYGEEVSIEDTSFR
ncbi:ABC transporter substrate-binding protein [Miniphocaeibacter massiliensis]|uniref:ABC transporter substrate-binding protein n=1 Tax=Miniphocaeibacter massiliensis TaxID=2041841 RepID=UPI000C06B495|nr:ABC transporter substrate-binding protein [Miniphocaeibacter massiliensis]